MEKLIIVGLSTNARHVFEFVKDYNLYEIVGFAEMRSIGIQIHSRDFLYIHWRHLTSK